MALGSKDDLTMEDYLKIYILADEIIIAVIAETNPDMVFAKVNTEEERELAAHFQVRSIPMLAIFKEQILVFSQPGALPASALEQLIGQVKELDMDKVRADIAEQQNKA